MIKNNGQDHIPRSYLPFPLPLQEKEELLNTIRPASALHLLSCKLFSLSLKTDYSLYLNIPIKELRASPVRVWRCQGIPILVKHTLGQSESLVTALDFILL